MVAAHNERQIMSKKQNPEVAAIKTLGAAVGEALRSEPVKIEGTTDANREKLATSMEANVRKLVETSCPFGYHAISDIMVHTQVRKTFGEKAMGELAASIMEHGIIQPLIVRKGSDDNYHLIAGERRLRAAKSLGALWVPINVMATTKQPTVQLIENIQREELNLEETAAGVDGIYRELGSLAAVAAQLGKSQPWVSKMLAVHNKLGKYAAELLAGEHTKDVELLTIMSRIEELENSWPRVEMLTEKIKEKKAGRQDAKDLFDELTAELAESADGEGGEGGEEDGQEESGPNFTDVDGIHTVLKGSVAQHLQSYATNTDKAERDKIAAETIKLIKDTVRAYQAHMLNHVKNAEKLTAANDTLAGGEGA